MFPGYTSIFRLFFFAVFLFASPALADTSTEGWAWSVGCPGDGTTFGGTFSATAADGSGFTSYGSCSRTSTHFMQLTFTSSSGATANGSTLYSLATEDWLITPPVLTTEAAPDYAIQSQCPIEDKTLNWIFTQWDTSVRTLQSTYLIGSANYDTSAGINVTGQWDVTGTPYWLGSEPMPGSCSTASTSLAKPATART